jgi:hypothetical protein
MDAFDYVETKPASPPRDRAGTVWNILSLIMLVGVVIVAGCFLLVFLNPYMGVNPFPPPTRIVLLEPTVTPTTFLPPTWTPAPTIEPTMTATLRPSSTPWPSPTAYGLPTALPTDGPSPTPGGMSFVVLQGSPMASPNIFHMDRGCNWMGVYGQVRDMSGHPIPQQIVHLGGTLDGQVVDLTTVTGLVSYNGEFGFEFELSDHPIASSQTLWLQLVDISGKIPLSDKVYIDTFEDCEKSMIVIYFVQVK